MATGARIGRLARLITAWAATDALGATLACLGDTGDLGHHLLLVGAVWRLVLGAARRVE